MGDVWSPNGIQGISRLASAVSRSSCRYALALTPDNEIKNHDLLTKLADNFDQRFVLLYMRLGENPFEGASARPAR